MNRHKSNNWFGNRMRSFTLNLSKMLKKENDDNDDDDDDDNKESKFDRSGACPNPLYSTPAGTKNNTVQCADLSEIFPDGNRVMAENSVSPTLDYSLRQFPLSPSGDISANVQEKYPSVIAKQYVSNLEHTFADNSLQQSPNYSVQNNSSIHDNNVRKILSFPSGVSSMDSGVVSQPQTMPMVSNNVPELKYNCTSLTPSNSSQPSPKHNVSPTPCGDFFEDKIVVHPPITVPMQNTSAKAGKNVSFKDEFMVTKSSRVISPSGVPAGKNVVVSPQTIEHQSGTITNDTVLRETRQILDNRNQQTLYLPNPNASGRGQGQAKGTVCDNIQQPLRLPSTVTSNNVGDTNQQQLQSVPLENHFDNNSHSTPSGLPRFQPPVECLVRNNEQHSAYMVDPRYQPYVFDNQPSNTVSSGIKFSHRPMQDSADYGYYVPPRRAPDINEMLYQPVNSLDSTPSGRSVDYQQRNSNDNNMSHHQESSFASRPSGRSSNYQQRSSGYTVKPTKFNGDDWEAYKLQFISCTRANRWSTEECGMYLAACLVGNAAYTLALKDSGEWTFEELWEALEERYGQPSSEFIVRNKLRKVRQQPNQGLQSLADQILQLVRGCSTSQSERDRLAVDAFIEALFDLEVRRYLLENEPANIQEALKRARKFLDIKSASGIPSRNPRVFNNDEVRGPNGMDPFKEIEELRAKQTRLEHELMMARQQTASNMHQPNRGGYNRVHSSNFRGGLNNQGNQRGSDSSNWRNKEHAA